GHDRRIAGDAARIESRRHDAAMAAPGLALAGQKAAAKPGLEQTAADLGLGVVRGIVQQYVPDGVRLVDDEGPPPQNAVGDDVRAEAFRLVRCQRVLADGAQELPKTHAAFRPPWLGKNGKLAVLDARHGACAFCLGPRPSPAYTRLLRVVNRRLRPNSIPFAGQRVAISGRSF